MGSEKGTREEVECGGNEDVEVYVCNRKVEQNKDEITRETMKLRGRNNRESEGKEVKGAWAYDEKRREEGYVYVKGGGGGFAEEANEVRSVVDE